MAISLSMPLETMMERDACDSDRLRPQESPEVHGGQNYIRAKHDGSASRMLPGSAPAKQGDPSLGGVSTPGCSSCSLPPAGGFLPVPSPACSPGRGQGGLAEAVEWSGLFSLCLVSKFPLLWRLAKPD